MKLKSLAVVIILLFIGLSISPSTNSSILDINNKKMFFQNEAELSINTFEASSPYDYGFKAGKTLNGLYRLIDTFVRFIRDCKIDNGYIENEVDAMKTYCPYILEELNGLSASTNIKLERLLYLKYFLNYYIEERCMTFACTGPATKNNATFIVQKIDTSNCHYKLPLSKILTLVMQRLIHSRLFWVKDETPYYPSNYKYVYYGIPLLFEWPLINEKGLGFGGSGLIATRNESRHFDRGPGITNEMLRAISMSTCKNVTEVAKLYRSVPRASAVCHQINELNTFCDVEGGILMIEQTHSYIVTAFGNSTDITGFREGILCHGGHHEWLDPNLTGSIFPRESFISYVRSERAYELLNNSYGNITLEICKAITRDHGGGFNPDGKDPADICRHTDKNGIALQVLTYIIQPKELTVYMTRGPSCRQTYRKYDFTKKLS